MTSARRVHGHENRGAPDLSTSRSGLPDMLGIATGRLKVFGKLQQPAAIGSFRV
ncbi:hypothetical protein AAH978_18570 [Streptomyces sp. ZYX-F-203]